MKTEWDTKSSAATNSSLCGNKSALNFVESVSFNPAKSEEQKLFVCQTQEKISSLKEHNNPFSTAFRKNAETNANANANKTKLNFVQSRSSVQQSGFSSYSVTRLQCYKTESDFTGKSSVVSWPVSNEIFRTF